MECCPDFWLCKPCIYGRIKETLHRNRAKRVDYFMKYIHTDITGPLSVACYNRSCYWVTFLNDNMQLLKAILIVNKSNMFPKFQKFLAKHKRPKRCCHWIQLDDNSENRI